LYSNMIIYIYRTNNKDDMQYSIAGGSILLIYKNSTKEIKKRWQINRYPKMYFYNCNLHSKFQFNCQVSQLSSYSIIRTWWTFYNGVDVTHHIQFSDRFLRTLKKFPQILWNSRLLFCCRLTRKESSLREIAHLNIKWHHIDTEKREEHSIQIFNNVSQKVREN